MKKICTKCGENKTLEKYYENNKHKDGKRSECKRCTNANRRKHYIKNKKKIGKYKQKYYKENEEKCLERQGKYYIANKEKILGKHKKYSKTEKGRLAVARRSHNRRINIKNTKNNLTHQEKNIILFLQNYKCIHPDCIDYFDEVEPTTDHIKPVIKGGDLIKENVQYLCRRHNSTKGVQEIDYRSTIHKQHINQEKTWNHNQYK